MYRWAGVLTLNFRDDLKAMKGETDNETTQSSDGLYDPGRERARRRAGPGCRYQRARASGGVGSPGHGGWRSGRLEVLHMIQ